MKAVSIGTDPIVAETVALSIRIRWPNVRPITATKMPDGLELVEQESPDLVLLYPDFADSSPARTVRELRSFSNVPIMVVSDQADEIEVVTALESGADDYVLFPCGLTVMMARIWALLRRVGNGTAPGSEGAILSGHLLINPATYEVFLDGERVTLTGSG